MINRTVDRKKEKPKFISPRPAVHIGIDNGVSGAISFISSRPVESKLTLGGQTSAIFAMPVKTTLNYQTSKAKNITRIDYPALYKLLWSLKSLGDVIMTAIERPMVNPGRFESTASALRAYEATIIALEELKIGYIVCDSKHWQKDFFPANIKGSANLKKASRQLGAQRWPGLVLPKGVADYDAKFIAAWAVKNSPG